MEQSEDGDPLRMGRWALATADAHGLYARHGFGPSANPDIHMFIERAPADLWRPQEG